MACATPRGYLGQTFEVDTGPFSLLTAARPIEELRQQADAAVREPDLYDACEARHLISTRSLVMDNGRIDGRYAHRAQDKGHRRARSQPPTLQEVCEILGDCPAAFAEYEDELLCRVRRRLLACARLWDRKGEKINWRALFERFADSPLSAGDKDNLHIREFILLVRRGLDIGQREMPDRMLKLVFVHIDLAGSGVVSAEEFMTFLEEEDIDVSDAERKPKRPLLPQPKSFRRRGGCPKTVWNPKLPKQCDRPIAAAAAVAVRELWQEPDEYSYLREDLISRCRRRLRGVWQSKDRKGKAVDWLALFDNYSGENFQLEGGGKAGELTLQAFVMLLRRSLDIGPRELPDRVVKLLFDHIDVRRQGVVTAHDMEDFLNEEEDLEKLQGRSPLSSPRQKPVWITSERPKVAEQFKWKAKPHRRTFEPEPDRREIMLTAVRKRMRALEVMGTDWVAVFYKFDDDGSGEIEFSEFRALMRRELLIGSKEINEADLKTVFEHIDDDHSGVISAEEFLDFINETMDHDYEQTDTVVDKNTLREQSWSKRGRKGETCLLSRKVDRNFFQNPEDPEQEFKGMLKKVRMRLKAVQRHEDITDDGWEQLFKKVEPSGRISYHDFVKLLRRELLIGGKEIPARSIKQVFQYMDEDGGGDISAEELVEFLNEREEDEAASKAAPSTPRAKKKKQEPPKWKN
eukprot:TRINITY_DN31294_c0_g2_i1.p1 TRINITY_DN31294_c0_g2~~TRINITY_DN31294_c0_g2_i1.p1  ORF type:complete len:688 (+),score=202.36 TRINITY_DN31294_c0_g2_i1:105-2168(+)